MSFHKNKVNMQHNFRPEIKRTDLTQANSLVGLRSRPYDGKIAGLYDLEETLGRGHFAVVKLARHVFTGEKVAVKVIDKSKLDEVSRAHLFQEVRCMKLVQHPNVVRLYEVIDTATKLYLVLELGDGGDLYEYILKHETGLPEKIAKEYFTQIVRAISYCHQLHVVHRDLKPENVVFFKNRGIVKLTDFGFSNKFYPGQKLETSCGSLAYSAPEILLGDSYDAPAVDVWSLGVILYMLVCGQPPFQEANDSETLTMIMDCKYDIPAHVSDNCRKLISRMLVKNPDKRATLMEITSHPWLSDGKQDIPDMFPLVSKEQLSEEDHNLIVQKIVNGNIATKEDILDCLEKNEYNHVTATYYLLAERKLKSKVQEQLNKNKRPDQLSVSQAQASEKNKCTTTRPFLSIPRTPGDLPQRSRKCSIVQEDEEEGEDISPCSRQENLGEPLIRRGSRSEGRLNLAVQERIAESEGRKAGDKIIIEDKKNRDIKITDSNAKVSILKCNMKSEIPKVTVKSDKEIELEKYNNEIPPSSQIGTSYLQLNEIFEESEMFNILQTTPRKFLNRNQLYEKRKLKFHKNRTASCSSSDASDDDSEKRKKQAETLNSSTKSFQGRRDSHDDSSDSQETGASAGSNENKKFGSNKVSLHSNKNTEYQKHKIKSNNNSGKKNTSNTNLMVTRKHKFVKKKNGKTTHLKENQSLNRINEVQEDGSSSVLISTIFSIHSNLPLLVADKAINESFIKNFNDCEKYSQNQKYLQFDKDGPYCSTKCQKKYIEATYMNFLQKQSIHDRVEKCNLKKSGILNKYFHVKKKICIALPELFNKTPLHQAQSYSSLTKNFVLHSTVRPTVVNKKSVINVEVETNQNEKDDTLSIPNKIKVSSTCQKLTKSYAPHIGNASKCYN